MHIVERSCGNETTFLFIKIRQSLLRSRLWEGLKGNHWRSAMENQSTKSKIIDAFLDILSQKSISRITVKDIASVAGISHMTFYRNFPDKYALIGEICYEDMMLFSKIYGRNAEWKSIVICILNTIQNNREFYSKVFRDEDAKTECLNAQARVSLFFTGAKGSRATYGAWDDALSDWARRDFSDPIDVVYRNLVASLPLCEIFSGEDLDKAIRQFEVNTLDDFRNRQKKA